MKTPRDLSGVELADALCRLWGYSRVHQEGSHIVLETRVPVHHRIAVPAHAALKIGTLHSILKAVAIKKGVSRDAIVRTL